MTDFAWSVADNGYAWAEDHREGVPDRDRPAGQWRVLVPMDLLGAGRGADDVAFAGDGLGRGPASRRYFPFRAASGLFRTFAETEPSEDGIRKFADRFGLLGPDATESRPPLRGERLDEDAREFREQLYTYHRAAETLDHWRRAIADMKRAVGLWERLPPNRKGEVARELQDLVEVRLGLIGVVPRFRLDPAPTPQPPLHLAPLNLHAAMWLQLAHTVSADRDLRRCEECGGWFVLDPDVNRSSRLYCTGPCRSRAYRARKVKARELRGAGRSVREIAKELGSDAETVRGWLAARDG